MLAGCATQKPAASSSEAASTAPAESSVVEETTPEEAPSEVTDVDEATAEDLKGIETGKVLCPCPECVRNAVLSLGEALGDKATRKEELF